MTQLGTKHEAFGYKLLNNTKSEEKRIQQNDCLKEEAFVICPCSGEKNSETSKNCPKIFQILVHSKSISLAIRDT